jgi:hypothetical protein
MWGHLMQIKQFLNFYNLWTTKSIQLEEKRISKDTINKYKDLTELSNPSQTGLGPSIWS